MAGLVHDSMDRPISTNQINSLVLDYLTKQGFHDAAATFRKEANLEPIESAVDTQRKSELKQAIYSWRALDAIRMLNEMDIEFLQHHVDLRFALMRLHLIHLISQAKGAHPEEALLYANQQMGPVVMQNQEKFLSSFEEAMVLVLMPPDKLVQPYAALYEPQLRKDVANAVLDTLNMKFNCRPEPKLHDLLRMRMWAHETASIVHPLCRESDLDLHFDVAGKQS